MQEQRRATIVGERTAGAANPGQRYPVNEIFEVIVPTGRIRSAVLGANWEGRGVIPDIAAKAGDALRIALDRARAMGQAAADLRDPPRSPELVSPVRPLARRQPPVRCPSPVMSPGQFDAAAELVDFRAQRVELLVPVRKVPGRHHPDPMCKK